MKWKICVNGKEGEEIETPFIVDAVEIEVPIETKICWNKAKCR